MSAFLTRGLRLIWTRVWTDIIPNADITTQLGKIHELQSEIELRQSEVQKLTTEFHADKTATSERVAVVEKALREKESELAKAERELSSRDVTLGNFALTSHDAVVQNILRSSYSGDLRKVPASISSGGSPADMVHLSSVCGPCGGTLKNGRCTKCGIVLMSHP
jgi:hypothetical protein